MMPRHWKFAIAVLGVFALGGLLTLPALLRNVLRLRRAGVTEEQARRAIVEPSIATPTDTRVKAQLFWASATSPGSLEPTTVDLPLSADPSQRAKQLIAALIVQVPNPVQRTLPADATLLQFYLLPDGTAVADFSEALGTETPSGILSEQMAVDSIVRTLAANVSAVRQLKILIRGQETDTLAGHLDLTGFFPVTVPLAPDSAAAPGAASIGENIAPSSEAVTPKPDAPTLARPPSAPAAAPAATSNSSAR